MIVLSGIKITETAEFRLEPGNMLQVVLDEASKTDNAPAILSSGDNTTGMNMVVQFMNAVPEIRGGIISQCVTPLVVAFCCTIQQLSLGAGTVSSWGIQEVWRRTDLSAEEESMLLQTKEIDRHTFSPLELQAWWLVFYIHRDRGNFTPGVDYLLLWYE